MGVIRVAEQTALGRTVVVKTLRDNYAADAAEHVLMEAWATGALEHPNIVPVHDIRVDENGAPLIVLKRIEGQSWCELMADADTVRELFGETNLLAWNLSILKHVATAVRFAHSRGILHRDLKPDNVMIGSFGEVYLVDWGIAMSLPGCAESRLPSAGDATSMAGTPCYMAPEMLGSAPLDERTDTYLLGAILYEILSGSPPHQATTLSELIGEIALSEPQVPEGVCPLLMAHTRRAMHRAPKERFSDAAGFAQALDVCIERRESMRLTELADTQRDKMETLLRVAEPSRHECYRLFGALRLGYVEALRVWRDNETAQTSLDAARIHLIEFELANGNPEAALSIYAELSAPTSLLRERIEEVQRQQRDELAELGKYRDDANAALGSRTRVFLIAVLGISWTVTPLFHYVWHFGKLSTTYVGLAGLTTFFMFTCGVLLFWARSSLMRTQVNRRLTLSLAALFPCQLLLLGAGALLKMPIVYSQVLMLFVWTMATASVVATVDRRFWPVALAYGTAFLVAASYPELRFLAMSAGSFVLTLVALVLWFPDARKTRLRQARELAQARGNEATNS